MTDPHPAELASHPVSIILPVQWGDQDSFGHVNNTVYFRWMESARIAYFQEGNAGLAMTNKGIGPILAAIHCNYRRQLKFPDSVIVTASVASIGRTSMKMIHRIYSTAQRAVAAEGESVIVMFDYYLQQPMPVADSIRAAIDAMEGRGPGPNGPSSA